jgi:hypothetical protein
MTEHDFEMNSDKSVALRSLRSRRSPAKRRSLLDQLLQVGTVDIIELPDGYAFHIDPVSVIAQHLEEFAALERLCCPFLTIAVRAGCQGRGRYWRSVVKPSRNSSLPIRRQNTTNDVTPSANLAAGQSRRS